MVLIPNIILFHHSISNTQRKFLEKLFDKSFLFCYNLFVYSRGGYNVVAGKTTKKGNKNTTFIIIAIAGIVLVIVGIVFLVLDNSSNSNSGSVSQNKLKDIHDKYLKADGYTLNANGKSDKGDVEIDAKFTDVLKLGSIDLKTKVGKDIIEKKLKFDVVDNRYEQSIKLDGHWYTSQVSDSIDSPVDVDLVDSTKILRVITEYLLKVDDKNQYSMSSDESESFIMATQLITDGAFESSLFDKSKVSLTYNLDKKKEEIKDVKICFGECNKKNLNIVFSDIKK